MRLIDADALIEEIRHVEELNGVVFDDGGLFDGNKKAKEMWSLTKRNLEATIDEINRRPTIEERKRGEWLPDNRPGGDFWVCSCCKFPSEAFAADKLYKYCPVCGCRMDGGKIDE